MSDTEKLLITSTHGIDDPERCLLPFIVGNGALALDVDVTVFLLGSAVDLAVKGKAAEIEHLSGMPEPKKLIEDFFALGGKVLLCGPCSNHRGIKDEDLLEGAKIGGAAALVSLAQEGATIGL